MSKTLNAQINSRNKADVTFFPLGDQIRFKVDAKIFSNESNDFLPNEKTLGIDDLVWNVIFGGRRATKRFAKGKKKIRKQIDLGDLGYENFDLRN